VSSGDHAHTVLAYSRADQRYRVTPVLDESHLPVHTSKVRDSETAALSPDRYDIIGRKVGYRLAQLAQRRGSYEIPKYVHRLPRRIQNLRL